MNWLVITHEQEEMMKDACSEAAPLEACGIFAGGQCYRLPNRSTQPGIFHLSAEDIREAAERHGGYEGVWHTHPSGDTLPSPRDWSSHPSAKALVVATRTTVSVYYGRTNHA